MLFKAILLLVLAIPACAVGYYFAVVLPAHNRATLELEKQKFRVEQEEKKSARDASDLRDGQLHVCLSTVDGQYYRAIKNNGTSAQNGSYDVDSRVLAGIERQKLTGIAECEKEFRK